MIVKISMNKFYLNIMHRLSFLLTQETPNSHQPAIMIIKELLSVGLDTRWYTGFITMEITNLDVRMSVAK